MAILNSWMIANPRFHKKPKMFWAYVRTLSQHLGYTLRPNREVKIPTFLEMRTGLTDLGLKPERIAGNNLVPTELGSELQSYFEYRAQVLNEFVRLHLMRAEEARDLYNELKASAIHPCHLPMNKQTGDKAMPSYFTGIINMLIASSTKGAECDYDPRELTTITKGGVPVRTLARRVDGAFPTGVNPIAVWEIKEYYYTTTFGSRIADGVYESLLDGMELEELRENEGIDVKHYLMVDAYETWWEMGRSYLCRIVDMLHMGYADEILFGREVIDRIPVITHKWLRMLEDRPKSTGGH